MSAAAFAETPPMQVFHAVTTVMEPTVLKGEAVLFDTASYQSHAPIRGDVVVLLAPDNTWRLSRIIGLPGDRVQLRGGQLVLDDREVPRSKIDDYIYHFEASLPAETLAQYVEALPTGANGETREHRIVKADDSGMLNDTKVFVVPPGHYFVLGDNRDHSVDSRTQLGFVPADAMLGRAISHAGSDIE